MNGIDYSIRLILAFLFFVPNSFAQDASVEKFVRVIYFVPNDRQPRPDINTELDTLMKDAQQAYADVMEANGFGRKTFRIETDAQGKVAVHHVTGQFNDTFYQSNVGAIRNELKEFFDTSENIYYAAVEISSERFDIGDSVSPCGLALRTGGFTPASGTCFNFRVIAHELGHTFGLSHDRYNRSDVDAMIDSFCAAEWLDVHPYFNTGHATESGDPTTITMIPPSSTSSPNAIRFRFHVTDTDGLHQAQLFVPDLDSVIACEGLNGDTDANVEFVTTKIRSAITSVTLKVIDSKGNISESGFPVDISNLLPPPQVITIPDANLDARVREFLKLSASAELTTHTMLRLTHFHSDPDRQITDITGLEYATNLITLILYGQSAISDFSVLRELKNLAYLELPGTSISDVSALANLTNLKTLYLNDTAISDVFPLAGLTNLETLELQNTAVSDLSPLVANSGLGYGDYVDVRNNLLSYSSIYTHIPSLQERGVEVFFDNRTPRQIRIVSGDDQQGLPGAELENPFIVEVQDERGIVFEGVPVMFAVTAGGGTLSTNSTATDANGKAASTLTLGPDAGTNTVRVSVEGSTEVFVVLTVKSASTPSFTLSIPEGTHSIHIPLKVNQINGEDGTIETVGDLYDALGDTVNLIITLGADGSWVSYLGDRDADSVADADIGDDTGLIVVMNKRATLELVGEALGEDGASEIEIDIGNNLVGVPLDTEGMISDLLIEGVAAIAVSKPNGEGFHTITAAGQDGDGSFMGGVGYIVVASAAANIPIVGSAWENEGAAAAPAVAFSGSQTPVLHVDGGVMDEFDMLAQVPELRVTVKNLSTGASLETVLGTEASGTSYSATFVEFGRHAAKAGDVLEITAHSPNPYVGVRPVPQIVVSAEEVLTSRIKLPDLELYEIPSETELLANYPNPFNPETWIPYRLAKAAEVTLDIYDINGRLVRVIDVGFKPAAVYESRASAIYWDGCNDIGEQVASGVYFYRLKTPSFHQTRRLVIVK